MPFASNSIIEVIDELFNDESNNEIEQIRLELEKGNKIKSLNILNNYKESISKILFQNPCSKKWYELIETDDWNEMHLIVKGNRLQHYVNGVLMSDVTDNDTVNQKLKGWLGMQVHVGPPMKVEFKDIRLKAL